MLRGLARLTEGPKRGWVSVFGGFILCLAFASDFSYPNINSYLTSYMRNNNTNEYNPELRYADFVYLSTAKTMMAAVSMPFIGHLCRVIGCKWSIAIGSAIYSAGFMLTWLTIKFWFPLAVLSLSTHGLAFSFIYATAIGAAQNWFPPARRGFVGSFVLCGYGFGSLIWVPFQTAFVNPDNVEAVPDPGCDEKVRLCDRYFTDPDLLARIPWMFLLSGAIYAVMGVIAFFLISEPQHQDKAEISLDTKHPGNDGARNLKPTQVLRTKTFYKIWFGFFTVALCNGLMSNYSKSFGLTFINNDHFFATVAIFQNLFNGGCRILWGLSYDRFGLRKCMIAIGLVTTALTASLPLLPYLGQETMAAKAGYGLVMIVLYGTFPGIYPVVAPAVAEAFGEVHYKANFGLLFTQSLAYSATILIITQVHVIYAALGYTGMFLLAGAFGVIGVINNVFLPRELSPAQQ